MSDTHLGFSDLGRIDPVTGRNIRMEDVHRVFQEAIDRIIGLSPDLVLHAGDLFHGVRVSNASLDEAMKGLRRLAGEGIPFYVVAGNHEEPRHTATTGLLTLLENQGLAHVAADQTPRRWESAGGRAVVYGLPHIFEEERQRESRERILGWSDEDGAGFELRLLLSHGFVQEEDMDRTALAQMPIPPSFLDKGGFDYVALGHRHKFKKVGLTRAFYPGSTERTQKDDDTLKAMLYVELARDAEPIFKRETLGARPNFLLALDAGSITEPSGLREAVINLLSGDADVIRDLRETGALEGSSPDSPGAPLVTLNITGLRRDVWRDLDADFFRRTFPGAFHYQVNPELVGDRGESVRAAIGSLDEELADFMKAQGGNYLPEGIQMEEFERALADIAGPVLQGGEDDET